MYFKNPSIILGDSDELSYIEFINLYGNRETLTIHQQVKMPKGKTKMIIDFFDSQTVEVEGESQLYDISELVF